MDTKKHYAAAILAFTIWGFFSIALRAVRDYSPGEILYFRILFSFILTAAIVTLFRRQALMEDWNKLVAMTSSQRWLMVALILGGGVLLTVNWLTYIYIINTINIKTASFTYLICPVLTAVLGYILLREKITLVQWIAVGMCALSCLLIGMNSALEIGYSLFTALTYALYLITQRKVQGMDRMVLLGVQVLFSIAILSMFYPLLVTGTVRGFHFYSTLIFIAVVFTILPLFLNLFALNRINSATIGILMYINPLLNFLLAITVFKESINQIQLIGYLVILVALILFNTQNFTKIKNAYQASRLRS